MDLVSIRSFDSYFTANMVLGRLQSDGVECYLKDENTVVIDPILTNAIGGIKLMVKDSEVDLAKALLNGYDEDYRKAAICPKCNSQAFSYELIPKPVNFLTAVLTWTFSSYAVATEYTYRCGNCGYETRELPGFNEDSVEAE